MYSAGASSRFLAKECKEYVALADRERHPPHWRKGFRCHGLNVADHAKCGRTRLIALSEMAFPEELNLLQEVAADHQTSPAARELTAHKVQDPNILDTDSRDPREVVEPRVAFASLSFVQDVLQLRISDALRACPVSIEDV